ncbi:cell division protein FtsQ/DivIB [Pelagibacterales bacterium SAG-MED08]|jgi:cell division protein FtsQ|nr:cell division protein FtsQ/DivIB [Pelagibacterales bacterium SAG-MED44]MBD1169477.1 cell division protein FtsQ/DivIB [Pelagibacterales bacterium SAG-MED08]
MHQQKGKKIIIYLSLFLIVGSINNTVLSKIRFDTIKSIQISGLNQNQNTNLLESIKELNLKNIFFLNGVEISKIISSNNLVENYEIFKKYPYALDIKIERTDFLAKINNNGKIFLIGTNGKLSDVKFLDKELPFIFGKPRIDEFIKFTNIIEQSKLSLNQVKNLYFFPSKRWDLELKNNVILKLSKDHTKLSLDQAFEILNDNNFNDIKIVDARIKNQIILND